MTKRKGYEVRNKKRRGPFDRDAHGGVPNRIGKSAKDRSKYDGKGNRKEEQ